MKIKVMDAEISVQRIGNEDYISLTDMARSQLQEHIIFKWLSNKNTIEYLGEWESLYNPDFNLRLGQKYVTYLLTKPFIEGNLFFMLTAYNAGPGNLVKWQKNSRYQNDPLLYIEVIPSAETRIYLERVLANYWIYNIRLNNSNPTLEQVASEKWPVLEQYKQIIFE